MKSSESRTNSKYKSPYGCRTNSHCVIFKAFFLYFFLFNSWLSPVKKIFRGKIPLISSQAMKDIFSKSPPGGWDIG